MIVMMQSNKVSKLIFSSPSRVMARKQSLFHFLSGISFGGKKLLPVEVDQIKVALVTRLREGKENEGMSRFSSSRLLAGLHGDVSYPAYLILACACIYILRREALNTSEFPTLSSWFGC